MTLSNLLRILKKLSVSSRETSIAESSRDIVPYVESTHKAIQELKVLMALSHYFSWYYKLLRLHPTITVVESFPETIPIVDSSRETTPLIES
jgi:hypothetical protein